MRRCGNIWTNSMPNYSQKKEGRRLSTYLDYERSEMIPLPSVPYEYFQKKLAKVQSNCCISYAKNFYSVPYKYIGSTVTLRIDHNRIDIYSGDEKLCSHGLIFGRTGLYVTDNNHFPPHSSNYGDWNSTASADGQKTMAHIHTR